MHVTLRNVLRTLWFVWLATRMVYAQSTTKIDLSRQVKGTLAVGNGGTGATTAAGARTSLGAAAIAGPQTLTSTTLTDPKITIGGCVDGYVLYMITASTGTVGCLTIPGGAPSTAKYVIQTADAGLPNAQVLGSLGTGIVKVTTTTGVLSVASGTDLPTHASRHQNGGNDEVATTTPGANAIPKAGSGGTLAAGWIPATAVSANTYGAPDTIPTFTVGADGRLTFAGGATPSLSGSMITSGTINSARVLGTATPNRCVHTDGSGNMVVASGDCVSGTGNVTTTPASNQAGYVPKWTSDGGVDLSAGYKVYSGTDLDQLVNSIPMADAGGGIFVRNIQAQSYILTQSNSASTVPLQVIATSGFGVHTAHLTSWVDGIGLEMTYIDKDGIFHGPVVGNVTGTASTATSLSGTLAQCSAGNVIHGGINSAGDAQGCGKIVLTSEVSGILPAANLGTGTPSSTTCLKGDGTWGTCATGGSGLTSVGLTMPAELTVTNSPLVANGTIGVTWANEAQDTVMMGPASGSGTPGFRTLGAAAIPNLDTSKLTSGTLALNRGGTGQSSWTASRCVQVDAGGSFLTSAAGGCVTGSGSTSTLGLWTGTSSMSNISYSTGATANTIASRGANGESAVRDSGGQVVNVLSQGADNTGATDARAALQAAIDAAPATGGVVFFPGGDYMINSSHPSYSGCGLVIGSGNPNANGGYSNINYITLQGVGAGSFANETGSSNGQRGASRLLIGTGGSAPTKLICLKGPMVGGGVKDLHLDGQNRAGSTAIDWNHVTKFVSERVTVRRFTSYGYNMYASTTSNGSGGNWSNAVAFYNCGNKIYSTTMNEGGSSFIPVYLSGAYNTGDGTYHTSCSNVFLDSDFNAGSSATYAVLADYADNNQFIRVSTLCNQVTCSGGGIRYAQTTDAGAYNHRFPYGNRVQSLIGTIGGTSGTVGNSVIDYGEQEGYPDVAVANVYWMNDSKRIAANSTGVMSSTCATKAGAAYQGVASDGTVLYWFGRGADSTNGFQLCSYDDINFYGSRFKPSKDITQATLSTGGFASASNGNILYCSDCTYGSSSCTGGGTGAIAKRINGAWRCD